MTTGEGELAVVLVHGSGSRGLCVWLEELAWLPSADTRVLAYDQPCVGGSDCDSPRGDDTGLLRVVKGLKRSGATRVVVVAASAGGIVGIEAASAAHPDVTAGVALSPIGDLSDALGTVVKPLLLALDPEDGSVDPGAARALRDQAPSLVTLAIGTGHAQELLYSTAGRPSRVRSAVLAFIDTARD